MFVVDRERPNFRHVGPDDRQRAAPENLVALFEHREVAQVFVQLRVTLKEHPPQLGVTVDDFLDARNVVDRRRTDRTALSFLFRWIHLYINTIGKMISLGADYLT